MTDDTKTSSTHSIYIDDGIWARLVALAEKHARSVSQMVEILVEHSLTALEQRKPINTQIS